ncbi:hypothetical protein CV770_25795 [Bradyrhizobium sp. AC87j1]|uniref:sacsin N-terminal ATP-binding-like domain-containing protein n=1 Tax=Bradyrhizobium sp. AC87j1 TaxID=2055894 RepID=UPI000CEBD95A|nr:hypothetical protein [Bradyrhizobium sp. AC87j1]PPQ16545.1 hypothetical protein CV770_25795 [Bradyrhizobium sp. AC87j1]
MDEVSDEGLDLVAQFQEALNEKVYEGIALRIRTKVLGARSDPDASSRRWPFELIQNAHDAGTRLGREGISLTFEYTDGVLRFWHDAAPFTMEEFASLLTGGSSKDFMSTETTGRFGTGFLVTHVLSEQVHVSGILEVKGSYRGFDVELDRPNDAERLLQNVQDSLDSLRHTHLVESLDDEPTASFEYIVDDKTTALAGLEALDEALPYLFATCHRLGEIIIRRDEHEVAWRLTSSTRPSRFLNKPVEYRVSRFEDDGTKSDWRVVRATSEFSSKNAVVVALAREGGAWAVRKTGRLPSIFRQLPLLGGPSLPGWMIVDGQFDVEQERRTIYVAGEQEKPLRDAFAALPRMMTLANSEDWIDGYRIAQLAMTPDVSGETNIKVWTDVLSTAAQSLSKLPLIRTARGDKVPCAADTDDERYADFIRRPAAGPTYDELWELAASSTETDPPDRAVSEGWSEVVEGWEELGVEISWIDLKVIGERAVKEIDDVSELLVDDEPFEWLSRYYEAVGKTWNASGITKNHLDHLVPNQHGQLRDADDLKIDGSVAERIKELAADVGIDIRAELLDNMLIERLAEQEFTAGLYAVQEATDGELTEEDALGTLLHNVAASLPDEQRVSEQHGKAIQASMGLLSHLWDAGGKSAEATAWRIPLLATDGATYKSSRRRTMMLPVSTWPKAARKFASAYPPSRVLDERYAGAGELMLAALTEWGVAYPGLIVMMPRDEIQERGLKPIAVKSEQVIGATLHETTLSQIALLEPELINYCRQTRERAQALFGLVVCYVASADASWRTTAEVAVKTKEGEKTVALTPSLWLSDLRSKSWIPVDEDGAIVHYPATAALVRDLLDAEWLHGNPAGGTLLVQHFGLDALDVGLLAAASDEETRQKLRDSLAKIIAVVGANSLAIEELAAKAQQLQRDVNLMRKLGLAVQQCVQDALEQRDLHVDPDDYGYDFLVTVNEVDPDDLSSQFQVAQYKVEVKTTTTGEPRLTPLQAKTCASEPETFVLCVIDLRDYPADVHTVQWTAGTVSPLCRLLWGTEIPISETLSFVEEAEGSNVPIRNVSALRYAVEAEIWEAGMDFDDWVDTAFDTDDGRGKK